MKIGPRLITPFLLLAIMALAVFFRFYELDSTPPGLYPDIAINGNNALQSWQTGDYQSFYTDNNGREGMIMWLDALSMAFFGITPLALKIPGAVFGAITVFGIYLLARELFGRRKNAIALLSAFFLATSFWHINFSRIGFRVILEPFFLVFAFYFLFKAFRSKKFLWAVAAGIFFGLGFYTYTGYRLAVPLLVCVMALWLVDYWKNKNQFVKISGAALLAAFAAALPIGIYFLHNFGDFIGRAGQTSVFASANPLLELGKSLALHLGMFNLYGDANWRHNLPGAPELFFPIGILFLIGIILAAGRIIKSIRARDFGLEFQSYFLLLLWFFFMLLPGILTSEGIPHALRTLAVIPSVMIMAAIGGTAVYDWMKSRWPKIAVIGTATLFIAATTLNGYWQYFVVWADNNNVKSAFTDTFVDIGRLTSEMYRRGWQTVVVVNENGTPVPYPDGIPMPAQTVKFIETGDCCRLGGSMGKFRCDSYSTYILPGELDQIAANDKTVVVPIKYDQLIFDRLSVMFPQGQIKQINSIKYYEINQ
ncbi:MAG: glycosyltransferase family 39 protein [Minisyncoccales bacterium]